jgi:hypothetical protein
MDIGRRKLPFLLELGAEFTRHGLSVRSDWRYELVVDYLKASPSYLALRNQELKYKIPWGLPSDYKQVKQVFDDFGPIYKMQEIEWWTKIGMYLYGVKAPYPKLEVVAELNAANQKVFVAKTVADSLVVQVPLSITKSQAIKEFKKLLEEYTFANAVPKAVAPKYQLTNSKLTKYTLMLGLMALRYYEKGMPLWRIGNRLRLIPGQCFDESLLDQSKNYFYSDNKEILSIAASRLIKTAVLIAENAARGRFPSDKPFKEAMLNRYKRKAGRPRKV